MTEVQDDPGPGATILIWIEGIVGLREELNARREQVRVWGPAVWAPEIEDAPWGARVLTIADPSGNHLRFNEPDDPALKAGLPRWGLRSRPADSQSWTGRAAPWMPEAPRLPRGLRTCMVCGPTVAPCPPGWTGAQPPPGPVACTTGSRTFDAYAERPSGCRSEEGRR
jgi:hypothetical protein